MGMSMGMNKSMNRKHEDGGKIVSSCTRQHPLNIRVRVYCKEGVIGFLVFNVTNSFFVSFLHGYVPKHI